MLIGGGQPRYIIETGITALGNLAQNFIALSTWTDSLRTSSFPQNWTIFYWAYWMVWCVATPFFIGTISKGRTIRQTILGGYFYGLSGTFTSFIILGNHGLGLQVTGKLDLMGLYERTGDLYQVILSLMETLPLAKGGLALLAVSMIAFYATSFDALTMVASTYSYKELPFAHARFCTTEGIQNVTGLSAFRNTDFGENYGVALVNGPLAGLLARAVIILNEQGQVLYTELVPEITTEQDYEKALSALK